MKKILFTIALISSLFTVSAQHYVLCFTNAVGGDSNQGTVMRYDINTHLDTVLTSFKFHSTGAYPYGSLVMNPDDSLLYGLAGEGGDSVGVLFSISAKNGKDSSRFLFNRPSGRYPNQGSLTWCNSHFYGMTYSGGYNNRGVIFSFDPHNNDYTRLYNFSDSNNDGSFPYGVHLTPFEGLMYGMTYSGGAHYRGTIYSFDPSTGRDSVRVSMDSTTGELPTEGALVMYPTRDDTVFYGVTAFGGRRHQGVMFKFDPHNNNYQVVVQFNDTNGGSPYGSILYDSADGLFYGMTSKGGLFGYGVIFSYDPRTGKDSVRLSFNGFNGKAPAGTLILGPDSMLYGLAQYGGTHDSGTLFKFNPMNDQVEILFNMTRASGGMPYASPTLITYYSSVPLSVAGVSDNYITHLYPNPARQQINLRFGSSYDNVAASIKIYDVTGKELVETSSEIKSSRTLPLDVSNLADGMYFVEISTPDNNVQVLKFVKQ
jgi:uncharacterized repeat protein (TIGR03803 family)